MAESFRSGIVSSTDMYYFCEDEARAVLESGAKMNIAQGFVSFNPDEKPEDNPRFDVTRKLYDGFNGSGDGRVIIDVSLHAEYTSHEKFVIAVADFAKELNAGMQVHISETKSEHEECKARHEGRTPTRYLADCGLFDVRTTAAHCVWADDFDIQIFADKGVYVASCPVSNLKLASGICDVPALYKAGVNVAIGTDSVASNNNLSMIEEMKFFALLNKERHGDPTLVSPSEAVTAATRTGALSQGRSDCGIISEGMKADLVLIDTDQPNMSPSYDFASNLVYAADAGNVALTMIDGKVVYENGEWPTIDVAKVKSAVTYEAEKIIRQL
jgi:5-methylthioadenosine/S-adenosylhomocysteine deaminase